MIYKEGAAPIAARVEDLLGRMTLKEKAAQLMCLGYEELKNYSETAADGIGTISYLNSTAGENIPEGVERLRTIQRFLVEETRLGIPGLAHNEGIAGAQLPGATTFPQSLGVGAAWEPELAERMGRVVKRQLKAFGIRAVHSPLFDLARDPRFGRTGEMYGEDPLHVAAMGTAFVRGVQGDRELMAAAKHFVGYGNSEGGSHSGEQQIALRKLYDTYCFPFEAAIHEGGLMAVMNSYGILNDEPVTASRFFLDTLLRGKMGFEGLTVSDYGSLEHIHSRYRTAASSKDAAVQGLRAGMDVEQPSRKQYMYLERAVREGLIEESLLDRSVRRVLETKFRLGLFERPYAQGDYAKEIALKSSSDLSLEIAEKSLVLVKNEGVLPLAPGTKVALIGPLSDQRANLFGGYSSVITSGASEADFNQAVGDKLLEELYRKVISEQRDVLKGFGIEYEDAPNEIQKSLIMNYLRKEYAQGGGSFSSLEDYIDHFYPRCRSVKEVLESLLGGENLFHARGCDVKEEIEGGFDAVRKAVEQADTVVAVLGGLESMVHSGATCGEGRDNPDIRLEAVQRRLIEEAAALGKPLVTVVIDGRPLAVPTVAARSQGLIYGWLPAERGAEAVGHVLTGRVNPGGKLPVTILKDACQIPMHYAHAPLAADLRKGRDYLHEELNSPLYPFGHGLSYTRFSWDDLRLEKTAVTPGECLSGSLRLSNSGSLPGDEVVQFYVRDCVAAVVRPVKQLVGFKRVSLNPGESREIAFKISMKQLAFHDHGMELVVEPGEMRLYAGASSDDIRFEIPFEIIGETTAVGRRAFFPLIEIKS